MTALRDGYIFMTCLSVLLVSAIVWIGGALSRRAGLPTISRMMEDDPDVMPFLWIGFAVVTLMVGAIASVATGPPVGLKLATTLLQFLAIMTVPVASLDFAYPLHMAIASMAVGFTIVRDWVFFSRTNTKLSILHDLMVLVILVLGLVFVVFANVVHNAENETYIASTEYALMKAVAALNIFYAGDITKELLASAGSFVQRRRG